MLDVAALGELLIDFTCLSSDADGYPTMAAHPGGAPANFLAALAKYGARCAMLGKVGDDTFGRLLLETLRRAGIETRGMIAAPDVFTTLAFVTLDTRGEREFAFARKPGADTCLSFPEIDLSLIDEARIFHFGSLSLTDEPSRSATRQAVAYARSRGKTVTYDPTLRLPLWKDPAEAGEQLLWGLEQADVVKISEEEVRFLFDLSAKDGAEYICGNFPVKLVFVTCGADGCFFQNARAAGWEPALPGLKIVDTTGAGDIGVRVEVRNEIMETVNEVLYESKLIGYPAPFKNKVRTFCQNPGGFVSQENYDNGLAVVNGHSFKEVKSPNTNLSILCSHNFSVPFNQPISYAQKVGELTNMLANGHILVQRYGDILDGKRTWEKELAQSNVHPTLPDAVAGDITAAMPYRSMTNIINFIKAVDQVVPGFASYETLLYSPELKFYSNRVKMDANLNTNIRCLHCLGDSSGWTRGLMMASVMGVLMGREIIRQENI